MADPTLYLQPPTIDPPVNQQAGVGIGLENRSTITPTPNIPSTPGLFGPDYSFTDNIAVPNEVGVRQGSDWSSVWDSLKAMGYYIDMIGFGESSSQLSEGLPVKPLGVNTWVKTGLTCHNGPDMWVYVQGIPAGTAFGESVANRLAAAGLPALKGLAPGIMEDAESALDPIPALQSVFGSGYPYCEYKVLPVGDQDGNLQNPETGNHFTDEPDTLNGNMQGRWTQVGSLDHASWINSNKTHCPDGYPVGNHTGNSCMGMITSKDQELVTNDDGTALTTPYVSPLDYIENKRQPANQFQGFQNPTPNWKLYVLTGAALVGAYVLLKQLQKRK
jgi:hypothetical protein